MSDETAAATVTVWSDYVCPFCYLEVPVLRRLRGELGERVELEWRAFELRPEPVPTLDPDSAYLDDVWASAVNPMAEARDMEIRRPPVQPRSRKALETAELARDRGVFEPVHEALFAAFFQEGRDLGDSEVLLDVAGSAGLDREELGKALEEGRYTEKVLQDQVQARELGVSGVPALFVTRRGAPLGEAATLEGAQPYDRLLETVRTVLADGSGDGGPDDPVLGGERDGGAASGARGT